MLLYGLSTLLYDFNMIKELGKFDWDWIITTCCACAEGLNFLKKKEKQTEKGKENIYCFYDIILLFKSIQEGRVRLFLSLMRTYYVNGLLRMLSSGGEIVLRKRYVHF